MRRVAAPLVVLLSLGLSPSVQAQVQQGAPDYNELLKTYVIACDSGVQVSCRNAAWMYRAGKGTPRDDAKAMTMYERSCTDKIATSCAQIGEYYWSGRAVQRDVKTAVQLFQRSCDKGYIDGCTDYAIVQIARDTAARGVNIDSLLVRKQCANGKPWACYAFAYANGTAARLEQALSLFKLAASLDSSYNMDETEWNHLCWHAAILDSLPTTFATMACDSAMAHDPSPKARDSYAVYLTRSGRAKEAVAHFEAYIEETSESVEPGDVRTRALRAEWIEAIKADKNPFSAATLRRLRLMM